MGSPDFKETNKRNEEKNRKARKEAVAEGTENGRNKVERELLEWAVAIQMREAEIEKTVTQVALL